MEFPIRVFVLAALVAACAGCGTGVSGGNEAPGVQYHVDASSGNDANPGTSTAPFRTLTHALGLAVLGDEVFVAPGHYDVSNGEEFPLVVRSGVTVIGDEAAKGGGDSAAATAIEGSGSHPLVVGAGLRFVSVIVEANATVAGFFVFFEEPDTPLQGGDAAMWLRGSGATLRNCRIDGPGADALVTGVLVGDDTPGALVKACCVRLCRTGIGFTGPGALEDSVAQVNGWGVVSSRTSDLGGGAAGSAGGNTITSNDLADLMIPNGVTGTVFALDNTWDHAPPTISSAPIQSLPPPGTDIWIVDGNGSVVTCVGLCPN